ncbi:MAG: hypothetical protein ACREAJ_00360 [Nitrosopumilaceae archaeon]
MKNRRRSTGKELLCLCALWGAGFGTISATLDWENLESRLILAFGVGLPAILVFAYFYGVKIDEGKVK